RASCISAKAFGLCAAAIQLADRPIETLIERTIGASAKGGQARDDAVEMRRQRLMPALRVIERLRAAVRGSQAHVGVVRDADCPAPVVESIQHVGFAEFNPHGAATRALRVVTLEVSIDAVAHDPDRDSPGSPSEYLLECGTDDP